MDSNLLKTKSIEQLVGDAEHGGKALRRTLTAMDLTLLGIGAIIGTGIFVLTGTAAANQAGPGIVLSYVLAGLACGFAALCYAEFAAMIPISGSAYTYAYATLGEIFAWMIGWDLILEYAVGSMTVAIGWSGYFQRILAGFGIAPAGVDVRLAECRPVGSLINLPAVLIVLGDHGAARHRRPRERAVQRGDGGDQARRRRVLHRHGRELRQARELVALHAVRVLRRGHGGGRRLFRLHRLRRRVDDRRGSEEPEPRPADRHHRVAGRLHGPLSGRGRHPLRHRFR